MVFGNDERLMAWVADGYKHKLFADDAKNDDDIRPCDSDSFVLLPEEKTDTYAELRIVTPEPLAAGQKRIRSATHTRTNVRIQRPGTAPPRAEYVSPYSQRAISVSRSSSPLAPRPPSSSSLRVGSAGSSRLSTKKYNEMRKGFTLVSKLYNKSKESQNINLHPASPDPDFRYFDRHSRCYGYSHMHGHLLYDRPQTACDELPCENFSRPVSALSNASRLSHYHNDPASMNQPQRYINYHRPRSSPLTRTELLTYSRANHLSRGNRPKFCDIVRQKELHYRDEEDRSESSEYNYYRQQGHLLTRWRKHSNARPKNSRKSSLAQEDLVDQNVNDTAPFQRQGVNQSNLSTLWMLGKEGRGGTEGRPGSPTSTVDGTDNQPDPPKEEESEPVVETKPDIITPSVIDIPDSKPSTKTDSKDEKKKTEPISVPSDRDGRQSPVQPPPSPEPLTPKEDPNKDADLLKSLREAEEEEERRRRALVKKEKKPIHRTRKPKEEMEEKVEPPKPATPPPPPQPIEDTKNKDIKVDLEVPSLPTFEDKKKDKKEKRKADRHLVSQPKHETPPPKDPEDDLDDQLKQRLKNFDFNIMEMMGEDSPRKNVQKATWVTGRLALSQQSSRFTLPIDMARLEQMTPLDYVKNFCIIKRRRKKLYQDIFVKHKDKTGQIPFKDLEKALTMVLVNTLTSDDYKRIVELLDISDSTRVDVDGFSAMAALAERLMCSTHVSQEQVDQPDYQKEKIECADFSALEWKLTGVQVNPKIVRILKELN
uniref:EF-hand domain-containing protein n=1 Tax=Magallana gigas TaxID=29159 RepID=A0A8W8MS53_MAGGI